MSDPLPIASIPPTEEDTGMTSESGTDEGNRNSFLSQIGQAPPAIPDPNAVPPPVPEVPPAVSDPNAVPPPVPEVPPAVSDPNAVPPPVPEVPPAVSDPNAVPPPVPEAPPAVSDPNAVPPPVPEAPPAVSDPNAVPPPVPEAPPAVSDPNAVPPPVPEVPPAVSDPNAVDPAFIPPTSPPTAEVSNSQTVEETEAIDEDDDDDDDDDDEYLDDDDDDDYDGDEFKNNLPQVILDKIKDPTQDVLDDDLNVEEDDDDDDDDDDINVEGILDEINAKQNEVLGHPAQKPTQAPTMPLGNVHSNTVARNYKEFGGFQSSWGTTYTGGMSFDFSRNSVIITGTTFVPSSTSEWSRSTCFAHKVPLVEIDQWVNLDDPLPAQAARQMNDFTVPDSLNERQQLSCHAIYLDPRVDYQDNLYISGVDEPDLSQRNGHLRAFLNVLTRDLTHPIFHLGTKPKELVTPRGDPAVVRYPVGIATGLDRVVLVMVNSFDPLLTEEYEISGDAKNPRNFKNSLLPPSIDPVMTKPKRGSNYFFSYEEYKVIDGRIESHSGNNVFPRSVEDDILPTGVASMSVRGAEYVFVGHISGDRPSAWKQMAPSTSHDMDGFVTQLRFPSTRPTWTNRIRMQSIEQNPPRDDYVHDVCVGPTAAGKTEAESFFVVGATYGTMPPGSSQSNILTNVASGKSDDLGADTLSAFVSKIDYKNFSVVWTTQLYAVTSRGSLQGAMTQAFGCDVITGDPTSMYVGGNVYDGGAMDSKQKSNGGDDIWIAQLNTADGSIKWMNQIGSSGDDHLSHSRGIVTDVDGDAVIYGETDGDLYRKRSSGDESLSDIFIATVDKYDGFTAKSVRSSSKVGLISTGVGLFVTSVVLGVAFYYFRFRRPTRRGKSRPRKDGVFNDNIMPTFADTPDASDVSNGFRDSADSVVPPQSAFQDDPDYRPEKSFV